MNILFYTDYKPQETQGGTERATISLAKVLHQKYGHRCYCLYSYDVCHQASSFCGDMLQLPFLQKEKAIQDFIEQNSIDIIIVQANFAMASMIRHLLPSDSTCRIIMVHHYAPGWEVRNCTLDNYRNVLNQSEGLLPKLWYTLKCLLFPLFRWRDTRNLHRLYRTAYEDSDKVVLLSEGHKQGYMTFAGINDDSKFVFIPNMLSFPHKYHESCIDKKKKEVLIVARMEEESKRISLALDIWKTVKLQPESKEWTLHIVGGGPDASLYKEKVIHDNISDIVFHGYQDPLGYYKQASIFMMTSRSEAWPLTLTESLQTGVVPIVFDSFAAVHDIINNNVDGIIIEEGDSKGYTNAILKLMTDNKLRNTLAKAGMYDCQRFSGEYVAERWQSIFLLP